MSAVSMARSNITYGWSIGNLAKKIDCRQCVSFNVLSTRKLTVAQGLLFELPPQHLGSDFGIQDLGKGFELPDGRSDEHDIFVFASATTCHDRLTFGRQVPLYRLGLATQHKLFGQCRQLPRSQ